MKMSLKQRVEKFESRVKLNYNIYTLPSIIIIITIHFI